LECVHHHFPRRGFDRLNRRWPGLGIIPGGKIRLSNHAHLSKIDGFMVFEFSGFFLRASNSAGGDCRI
jgi:hypothetical protein